MSFLVIYGTSCKTLKDCKTPKDNSITGVLTREDPKSPLTQSVNCENLSGESLVSCAPSRFSPPPSFGENDGFSLLARQYYLNNPDSILRLSTALEETTNKAKARPRPRTPVSTPSLSLRERRVQTVYSINTRRSTNEREHRTGSSRARACFVPSSLLDSSSPSPQSSSSSSSPELLTATRHARSLARSLAPSPHLQLQYSTKSR